MGPVSLRSCNSCNKYQLLQPVEVLFLQPQQQQPFRAVAVVAASTAFSVCCSCREGDMPIKPENHRPYPLKWKTGENG